MKVVLYKQAVALLQGSNQHTSVASLAMVPLYCTYDEVRNVQHLYLNMADLKEVLSPANYTLITAMLQPEEHDDKYFDIVYVIELVEDEESKSEADRCKSNNNN